MRYCCEGVAKMSEYMLKPCPFCGSRKLKIEVKNGGTRYRNELMQRVNYKIYTVRCNSCFARGGTSGGLVGDRDISPKANIAHLLDDPRDLRERAVELWNRRE